MDEDEPAHLIVSSIVRENPILSIDRKGVAGFWSKILGIRFLQDTAYKLGKVSERIDSQYSN